MALTIVATVGSASANSFVTLVEAAAYMEGRLNSDAWDNAGADEQNRALAEATREIDQFEFVGRRSDTTQVLAWPRQWAPNPDDPNYDYYAVDAIPQRVKNATMELAFQFLKAGTTDVAAQEASEGVIRKKVDVLETEYARPYERSHGLARFPRVMEWLAPLVVGSTVNRDLARG